MIIGHKMSVPKSLVWVADGDSNTQGYNILGAALPGAGYPQYLATFFNLTMVQGGSFWSDWMGQSAGFKFHNLANGGKSLSSPNTSALNGGFAENALNNEAMYSRWASHWKPDAIFFSAAGLVDFLPVANGGLELTPAQVYAQMQTMWATARGIGYKVIAMMFPYNKFRTQADHDTLAGLIAGTPSLYDAYVDGRSIFTYANANANTSDGVHLNATAQLNLAVLLIQKVAPLWRLT